MIELNKVHDFAALGLLLQNKKLRITKSIEDPILIVDVEQIEVGENVSVQLIETDSNHSIEIVTLEGSIVEYQVLFSKNMNRKVKCGGSFHIMEIALHDTNETLEIDILKESSKVNVELLSIANACRQTILQRINHLAPNANSNISNFGVAMKSSEILFDTTGKIEQGMAKSKCVQLSKGIVMDDTSTIISKPILLIDEYDVVANHGASIGKMSDDILFYLMSRGLSKNDSFLLILEGIVSPFINRIKSEELQKEISDRLKYLMMG